MYLLLGLIIVFFVALAFALLRKGDSDRAKEIVWEKPLKKTFPYIKRPRVLYPSEAAFFHELKKQLPPEYQLHSKIRIIDFLDANSLEKEWRNKIWAKHVDFLICDRFSKPIVAIEINGMSHHAPERIQSDKFKKEAFHAAQLPLEVVRVGDVFAQVAENIVKKYTS